MQSKSLYTRVVENVRDLKTYQMILEYYIVEKTIGEGYCELKSYGIQITKISTYEDGRKREESELIQDIFFDRDDTLNFIQTIADHRVTPATLKDVIDDFIGRTIEQKRQKADKTA